MLVLQQKPGGAHIGLRFDQPPGDANKLSFMRKRIPRRRHDRGFQCGAVPQDPELAIFKRRAERAGCRKPEHLHNRVQRGWLDFARRPYPHPVLLILDLKRFVVSRMSDSASGANPVARRSADRMTQQALQRRERQRRRFPRRFQNLDEFRVGHPHLRGQHLPHFVDGDGVDSLDSHHSVHQAGKSSELIAGRQHQNPGAFGIEMHDGVVPAQGRPRLHRPHDAGEFDEMAVIETTQQLASGDTLRLREAGLPDYPKGLYDEVWCESSFLEIAPDLDFLAKLEITRAVHVHRQPNGGFAVLDGDLGLLVADVIDDAARSCLDVETLVIREFTQLADAHEWSILCHGPRNDRARGDAKNQKNSADCTQHKSKQPQIRLHEKPRLTSLPSHFGLWPDRKKRGSYHVCAAFKHFRLFSSSSFPAWSADRCCRLTVPGSSTARTTRKSSSMRSTSATGWSWRAT